MRPLTFGLLVHPDRDWFFEHDAIVLGAHRAAQTFACRIIASGDLNLLEREPLDGLVVQRAGYQAPRALEKLRRWGLPLIQVPDRDDIDLPAVEWDNASGIHSVVDYLVSLGHRRFGFVSGPESERENDIRRAALEERLARYDCVLEPHRVFLTDSWFAGPAFETVQDHLVGDWDFTALVCANDQIAHGTILALRAHGIDVPRQVSVTGFDNFAMRRFADPALSDPPLTTVALPAYEVGFRAVEILYRHLSADAPLVGAVVPTRLVPRRSCSPALGIAILDSSAFTGPATTPPFSPSIRLLRQRRSESTVISPSDFISTVVDLMVASENPLEELSNATREAIFGGEEPVFYHHLASALRDEYLAHRAPDGSIPSPRQFLARAHTAAHGRELVSHYREFYAQRMHQFEAVLGAFQEEFDSCPDTPTALALFDELRRELRIRHFAICPAASGDTPPPSPTWEIRISQTDPGGVDGMRLRWRLSPPGAGLHFLEIELSASRLIDGRRLLDALQRLLHMARVHEDHGQ